MKSGLADDANRGHAGLGVLRTDVEHHYSIVSGIGNEEAIVRVVVENAAGVIQLRVSWLPQSFEVKSACPITAIASGD